MWPVTGWIAATDVYATGAHHHGSADIAAPHFTPVQPARSGRVAATGWSETNGWYVRIDHGGLDGYTYQTRYAHLLDEPQVAPGDLVSESYDGGTVLGYVGRTGNAEMSGPHVHFGITRIDTSTGRATDLAIPEVAIGDWVHAGEHIPGRYPGLTPIPLEPARPFDVRVTEPNGVGLYETSRRNGDELLGTIPRDTVLTVFDSRQGQYRVRHGDHAGWISHSGTLPSGSTVSGLRIEPGYASVNVRRSPGGEIIGTLPGGTLLTAFSVDESGSWYRVQWPCTSESNRSTTAADRGREHGGCPNVSTPRSVKYGWVSAGVSDPTPAFRARTRIERLAVYGGTAVHGQRYPDTGSPRDRLRIRAGVTVTGSWNGWYRIDHDGEPGWIRGWFTAGRQ
ncbi:M23 family metallopeptidase [Haloechinothrix sp. LS1_15]|uniref:M23 family metallopeptidase n=1 Tax=Haloechinothrix sp. LS1_15 TaxID=2652248 RepID=UPI00294AF88A|nr:M23 family metallopeptidase [Haloechinothrix sp. LS1_15]